MCFITLGQIFFLMLGLFSLFFRMRAWCLLSQSIPIFQFGADKSLLQMANEVKRHPRSQIFNLLLEALWHPGTYWEWSGGKQQKKKSNHLLKSVWLFGLRYWWFIGSLSVINLQKSKRINIHLDRSLNSEIPLLTWRRISILLPISVSKTCPVLYFYE